MLLSLKWLNEFVQVDDLNPQELADLISLHGVEIDAVYKVSEATGVVVGYVEEKIQHPDADKLSICQVDVGNEVLQIVCGAKNVAAGQKVPVAVNGAVLPGGFKIKKTKLRGQASNGMICSASELGLPSSAVFEEISEGIWVLPADAPVGADAINYLGLDDYILELGLTPNRMDMLSVYGAANDIAAILNRKSKPFGTSKNLLATSTDFSITSETDKCYTYLGKLITGVTVGQSTLEAQMKLMATSNKPINNVVDLTNRILFQTGLPVHAFDADKLPSKHIIVREAKEGETVVTLDNQERKLEAGDILITSGNQIIAIAGIMGSASSSVDENTKNVLFEAAIFDRKQIRKTASRLNLRTNASARFEKGINVARIFEASFMIDEIFDNAQNIKFGSFESPEVAIEISLDEINSKLGTTLSQEDVSAIFERLNLTYNVDNQIFAVNPSNRMIDVLHKHDLVEEIARIYGFNNIPSTLPSTGTQASLTTKQKSIRKLHQTAQAAGLQNVITYSLVNESTLKYFLPSLQCSEAVGLSMPLSLDHAHLRKSLIPSLLQVVAYNNARQIKDVFIYEIGKANYKNADQYFEKTLISGVLSGEIVSSKWQNKKELADFYNAKGAVDALIASLGFVATYKPMENEYNDFHPGQTATVYIGSTLIGVVGKLHPNMKKLYDVNDTYAFELDFDAIVSLSNLGVNYTPVSKYPGISFDIALLSDYNLPVANLVETIRNAGGNLLKSVEVFDIYTGIGIEDGKKSVAINLYYQDDSKTLTDDEVNPVHEKVLKSLETDHDATLRS